MKGKIYFTEKQKATQSWIWILMISLILFFLYISFDQYYLSADPISNNTRVILIVSWVVILSSLLLLISFRLDTRITEEGVFVQVFPFHLRMIKYPWEEIQHIFIRKYKPIREYGGWGIRGIGKNRAFNAKGNMGIQLNLKDGKKRLIGTSKPNKAEEAISEVQKEAFKGKFSKQAQAYSLYRPSYPSLLLQHVYAHCPSFEKAWDVGCGNGQVTGILSKKFKKVIGTDISNRQIQLAQQYSHIEYNVGPAESISLEEKFDLITVAQALHWFDRDAFYKNVQRHLKPEGIFAAFGYGHARINDQVNPLIDQLFHEILEDYWDPSIHLVKNAYKDITIPFEEIDSPEFTYFTEWKLEELLGFFTSWSAVQEYKDKEGSDPVDIIRKDLTRAWGEN